MYADSGVMFSYFQTFSQQIYGLHNTIAPSSSSSASTLSEYDNYDLGGEGDLFKAPEPIIEEAAMGLDPMAAAISMLSCNENVSPSQIEEVMDIGSIQNEQLLNEVLYECEMDLLAKSAIEESYPEVQVIKLPAAEMEMDPVADKYGKNLESSIQKSVSSGCLTSIERILGGAMRPTFPVPYGMRRAYSEGDMQNLGNGNASIVRAPSERPVATIGNCTIEERREKLSRYWKKKSKRNFSRKIKYACRKALADSQPRIRGRFAKTQESEICKKRRVRN
ncbi:hypothetical protein Scep_025558 [Stephania cephalantha]|uniref:CCT domain-containing protein n=1 Tax=Stephania cephalantha TaxID=152367 RepID=A0AAP0ESD8_9MAGN